MARKTSKKKTVKKKTTKKTAKPPEKAAKKEAPSKDSITSFEGNAAAKSAIVRKLIRAGKD